MLETGADSTAGLCDWGLAALGRRPWWFAPALANSLGSAAKG